jgi:hypothetical protein
MSADFYSYRPLPATEAEAIPLWREMAATMPEATFHRLTVIDDASPWEYPEGMYVEGWLVEPKPCPPFWWPMTFLEKAAAIGRPVEFR